MSDKKIDLAEYQYPGDEYVSSVPVTDAKSDVADADIEDDVLNSPVIARTNSGSLFIRVLHGNKRKLLGLGAILAAVMAFQMMHHHDAPEITSVSQAQPAPQTPDSAMFNTHEQQAQWQQSLSTLQQDSQANNQQIADLKSQLASMNEQLQAANDNNQQLKQAMVMLLQQLRDVTDQLAKKSASPATTNVAKPAPAVVYAIRAMVDGRAWIQGSNGLTQSVTVGDPIPDYGNVTSIQAAQGVIMTTSGKEIRLGANDY